MKQEDLSIWYKQKSSGEGPNKTVDLARFISFIFIVSVLIAMIVLATTMVTRSRAKIQSRMQYFMNTTGAILDGSLSDAIWNFDEKAIEKVLESVLSEPGTPLQAVHIYYPSTGENLIRIAKPYQEMDFDRLKASKDSWVKLSDIKHDDQAIAQLTIVANPHSLTDESNQETVTILSIFLICFFIMSFAIVRILHQILTKPLAKFVTALHQAKFANYNAEIDEKMIGELGLIAAEFNSAIKAISDRDHKLSRYAHYLEDEVKEGVLLLNEQKMKAENSARLAALGELSAGVAHEINNPLAIITASAEKMENIVSRSASKDGQPEFLKEVTRIKKMVDRISKIVKGLRTFSRDGSNDTMTIFTPFRTIEELLNLVKARIIDRGIDITVECDENVQAWGNEVQISQVLINLINNSVDAIEKTEPKWINLIVKPKGEMLEFSITDSGNGISPEFREKIFQPFYTTKEIGKGTGLGLSIAHGIIKSHLGHIEVDANSPNTRIAFTIPMTNPTENNQRSK